MVTITNKPVHDPVAEMLMVDAYMRWVLEAAEEVIGKSGLVAVLRESGLEKFIDAYPANQTKVVSGITFGDYANLNAGLLTFFGRAGKSMVMRIGRISARKSIEHQSGMFNLATVMAAKLLPAGTQLKMGMSAILAGFRVMSEAVGQEFRGAIEDKGDCFHYIVETDPLSAGKCADAPIGWLLEATLEEGAMQVFNKQFDYKQIACRSMGAPASIWEVSKTPLSA